MAKVSPAGGAYSVSSPHDHDPSANKSCGARVRDGILSLRFFLLFLMVSSLLTVTLLAWRLTLGAAEHSLALVTEDYSSVLMNQLQSDLRRRLSAAEHITAINAQYFAKGYLKYDGGGGVETERMQMFFQLQVREMVKDTVSSVTMTTADGQLNGFAWYFPTDGVTQPYLIRWDAVGSYFTEYLVDSEGQRTTLSIPPDPAYNASQAEWITCVDLSDPQSHGWTAAYLFPFDWFLSESHSLYDSNGDLVGVATIDMQLGFTDSIAKELASSSNVGTNLFIVEAFSTNILGSSLPGFQLTDRSVDPAVAVFMRNGPPLLKALHKFILTNAGRPMDTPVNQQYVDLPTMSGEMTVDGSRLLVTVKTFVHGPATITPSGVDPRIRWVLIHVLDRSAIESEIDTSNTQVLISVLCICFGFVALTAFLLFYALRLVESLSRMLVSFARFEFRHHVQGGQLKSRSVFSELRDMESAVLEMTKAFKQHLDGKGTLFGGRHGGTTGNNQTINGASHADGSTTTMMMNGQNHSTIGPQKEGAILTQNGAGNGAHGGTAAPSSAYPPVRVHQLGVSASSHSHAPVTQSVAPLRESPSTAWAASSSPGIGAAAHAGDASEQGDAPNANHADAAEHTGKDEQV